MPFCLTCRGKKNLDRSSERTNVRSAGAFTWISDVILITLTFLRPKPLRMTD